MLGGCRRAFFLPPPAEYYYEEVFEYMDGIPWYHYFSPHETIQISYHPFLGFLGMYQGDIQFWEFADGLDGLWPNIDSTFYSWYCHICRRLQHRFTDHMLSPDGRRRQLHCVDDYFDNDIGELPHFPYDPDSDHDPPPFFHDLLIRIQYPDQELCLLTRFLIIGCRVCETHHWYLIQGLGWCSEAILLHFCRCDPLNHPISEASRYQPDGTEGLPARATAAASAGAEADTNGRDDPGSWNVLWKVLVPSVVICLGVLGTKLLRPTRRTA